MPNLKILCLLFVALLLAGCNKAIYFEADDGTISVPGGSVHGENVKYHSVPCNWADCSGPTHPMGKADPKPGPSPSP